MAKIIDDETIENVCILAKLSLGEEAKAKAKAMKEETASKIRSGSQEAEEAAHKASEAKLAEAEEQAQKEADALRQLVEPKREEALEAVITSLV